MRTRRGSEIWVDESTIVNRFSVGDIVRPLAVHGGFLTGIVTCIDPKINKVMVSWGAQSDTQHDPEEIVVDAVQTLATKQLMNSEVRVASRRGVASESNVIEEAKPVESSMRSRRAAVALAADSVQTRFLSADMERTLNEQVGYEMYSAYLYFAVGSWFEAKGLKGFAKHMNKNGHEEIAHAMKVLDYLNSSGSNVGLPVVQAPIIQFNTVQEATRAVLDHEMSVTQRWQVISEMAKHENNAATCKMAQEFMEEQVEEEDNAVTLHQRVQLADTGSGLLVIDHELD